MQALRLPAARGWHWIAGGFRLYRRNAALLIMLALNYWLFFFLVFVIPFVGPIAANIVLQVLSVTVMNGCRAIDNGAKVAVDIVWSGFRRNLPSLLRLGALYLAGELAIAVVLGFAFGTSLAEVFGLARATGEAPMPDESLLPFLYTALALTVPLILAFWFAPILVAWHDIGAVKAVFFSAVAVMRNWRAFAVYGVTATLLTAVVPGVLRAAIGFSDSTAMLGNLVATLFMVLVVMPTLFAGVYMSYREIFAAPPDDADG
jgi:hypothetical protein